MKNWYRIVPFNLTREHEQIWIYKDSKGEKCYNVEVFLTKPIDILKLKQNIVEDFNSNLSKIKSSRKSLFENKNNLESVSSCPVCNYETDSSKEVFRVYGATYNQCSNCTHVFLIERPTKEALDDFYSKDKKYQSTYADTKTTETRVQQVSIPKLEWVISIYKKIYGREPKSILDVGAGSGHFCFACRERGLRADGVEISESGNSFCEKHFGFSLINKDFIQSYGDFKNYEIITFWGVIEHISNPLAMLDAAHKLLSGKKGLIVTQVPRWNSFGTSVQKIFNDSIVRHLDPLGHINCFTDLSHATAYNLCGFNIKAAWYFGMDIYEFILQTSNFMNNDKIIKEMGPYIPFLQDEMDLAMLSDGMIFIGIPS